MPPSQMADDAVLVGLDAPDDAAVYRISDDLLMVQTVDFFTPIVDDPYDWGAIAAANALSDIYAMGAAAKIALNLAAWPREDLDLELLAEVMRGGAEKVGEAGVSIVGGHTIDDREPKYGMAVTGFCRPDELVRSSTARPGDVLVLTKAIGTGVITTALKHEKVEPQVLDRAVESMKRLNDDASRAMVSVDTSAATDVTGFGLIGHLHDMALLSGVAAVLESKAVPLLPGAEPLASQGVAPGGTQRNVRYFAKVTTFEAQIDDHIKVLLNDAQTSGGLLISVPKDGVDMLLGELDARSVAGAVVGHIEEGVPGSVRVV